MHWVDDRVGIDNQERNLLKEVAALRKSATTNPYTDERRGSPSVPIYFDRVFVATCAKYLAYYISIIFWRGHDYGLE